MIKAKVGTDELFRIANHLVKGLMSKENVLKYLILINKKCCEEPLPESEIIIKVESASRGKRNWSGETRDWVEATKGYFSATEIHRELQAAIKDEKRAGNAALQRLAKGDNAILERHKTKNGYYRLIDKDIQEIDWKNVKHKQLDIRYPFGLEKFFITMPKNLIVLAGSPDSGKTALLLNFIRLNMKRHKINYFSSEMGALELRSRLEQASNYKVDDWKFKAVERSSNFVDVIQPDEINVIDYLEMSDTFYQIGGYLSDIYEKLHDGIAVIAIQKDKGSQLGRGASFSLEKSRLYLTVDSDFPGAILKIQKAKNWRKPNLNPNGYEMRFKILNGINLLPEGTWDLPVRD